jgi:hypothetical protein
MAYKADVAQLVEQLIRNQQVCGSIPHVGSNKIKRFGYLCQERFFCFLAKLDVFASKMRANRNLGQWDS